MSGFKYIETNRVSKAQKRRDAKAAKKAEQLKRIEEGEKLDEHKDRRLEQEKLNRLLKRYNLKIYDIEADGDCLYRAIEHQLKIACDPLESLNYVELREKTSKFMLDNEYDFIPFLLDDKGDIMNHDEFKEYCSKIVKTKAWGGHLELTAISRFTQKPIHIFQADNDDPIVIKPQSLNDCERKPMLLCFHKHLYHLGEHYNSLIEFGSH